jgi:L-threonylcarbamoyladenylate synthase
MIQVDNPKTREEAARIVASGGVIAFRTDTFYGLGADPLNVAAVQKVKQLKGREDNKPILLLISDLDQVDRFVDRAGSYKETATKYWPAPLTLIGTARSELSEELTAGSNSIGLRLPNDDDLRSFVRICGGALTATSANISGGAPARTAIEVENYFPRGVDLIIDGGEVTATEASTVVEISGARPHLIREGAFKLKDLERS